MCDLNALNELERSDYMLCTNSAWLHYKDKYQNDGIFVDQMSRTQKWCLRDIDIESKFFNENSRSTKAATCSPLMLIRGGSALNCEPNKICPKLYTSYNMGDFLLQPCPKNTYKNYQVFDDKKQCSKSHQLLNNWTKRKELTGYENIIR